MGSNTFWILDQLRELWQNQTITTPTSAINLMTEILLADDDIELCSMLQTYLVDEGFSVTAIHDGESAQFEALNNKYDLVVLDIMLPKLNGLDVLKNLRQQSQKPVLILSARGDDVDSIVGLELGADDYLGKPCNPRVLAARIRAVLRRTESVDTNEQVETIRLHDVELHTQSRRVYRQSQPIELTATEFTVLEILMRRAGQIVNKNTLSMDALGRKLTRYDRSLDMHISNIRKKLDFSDNDDRIKTIRNIGYLYVR
ncbi:response regulator [Kaarinaea lacus]